MADDLKNTQTTADGGQDPAIKADDKQPDGTAAQAGKSAAAKPDSDQQADRTFTQAELEAIIADRLKREREKYRDYADLKKAAEEYKKLKEAQMSEQEKLQAKVAEFEKQLLEKEREAAEARNEILKLKILDELGIPRVLAGRIFGTTEEEIRQDAAELKKLLPPAKPASVGGATNPANSATDSGGKVYTRAEIEKMTPEEINKNWSAIEEQLSKGLIK